MDVVADLLHRAQARGALFARLSLRAPWGIAYDGALPLGVHAILGGTAWLRAEGHESIALAAGDVVLVRGDVHHELVDGPTTTATEPMERVMERWRVPGEERHIRMGGRTGRETVVACGAYRVEGGICDRLLDALPPIVHVPAGAGAEGAIAADGAALRDVLGMLSDELCRAAPGQQTVLDRLLDLLLVFSLRAWFARAEAAPPPWYRALGDPVVGPALRRIHEAPAAPWTVAALAAEVGASRAAFARRFASVVGAAPLSYLTDWRMALAAESLRDGDATLAQIARDVGYASEFAFSAAFKRHTGEAPAHYRRRLASLGAAS